MHYTVNCHQGDSAEQALRNLIQPDLTAQQVIEALQSAGVEPDAEYTADAGRDYGHVAAWKFSGKYGKKYAIKYENNARTDYDWADDADDLACWLESPDLDGPDTIIQTANVRGEDAVPEASEDDEGPFYILVSHDYYGPYSTHDLVRDRDDDYLTFGAYADARKWVEAKDDGIYITSHNEIGRPSYKIVTA